MDGDNNTRIQTEHSEVSANASSSSDETNVVNESLQLEGEEGQSANQDDGEQTCNESVATAENAPLDSNRTALSEPENISDINTSHEQNNEVENNSSVENLVPQPTHFFRLDHSPSHSRRRNGNSQAAGQEEIPSDNDDGGLSDATTAVVSDSEGWQAFHNTQPTAPKEPSSASSKTSSSSTPGGSGVAFGGGEISGTVSTLSSFTSSLTSSSSTDGKKLSNAQDSQLHICPKDNKVKLSSLILDSPDDSDHDDTVVLESANVLLASTPTGEGNESPVSEQMLIMENLDDGNEENLIIPQSPEVLRAPPKILPSTPTEDDLLEQDSQVIIAFEDDKTVKTDLADIKNEVDDSVKEATKSCVSDLVEPSVVKSSISSRSERGNPTKLTAEQLAKGVELSPVKITSVFASHTTPSVSTICREFNFQDDLQHSDPHQTSLLNEITHNEAIKTTPHSKSEMTLESLNSPSKLYQKLTSPDSPVHLSKNVSYTENLSESSSFSQKKTEEDAKCDTPNLNEPIFASGDVSREDPAEEMDNSSVESVSLLAENTTHKEMLSTKCDRKEELTETNLETADSSGASESLRLYLADSVPMQLTEEEISATNPVTSSNPSCVEIGKSKMSYANIDALKEVEESVTFDLDAPEAPLSQASETMELSQELTWTSEKNSSVDGNAQRDPFAMLRQPDLSFREMMLGLPGPSGLSRSYSHDSDTDSDSLEVKKFQKPKMSVKELLKSHDMMMRLTEQNMDKSIRGKGIGKKSKPRIDKDKLKLMDTKTQKVVPAKKGQLSFSESHKAEEDKDSKANQTAMHPVQDISFKTATEILESMPKSPAENCTNQEKSNDTCHAHVDEKEQSSRTIKDSLKNQASINVCDKTILQSVSEQKNTVGDLDHNFESVQSDSAKESSPKAGKGKKKQAKGKDKRNPTKNDESSVNVIEKRSASEGGLGKKDQKLQKVKLKNKFILQPKIPEQVERLPEKSLQAENLPNAKMPEALLEQQLEDTTNSVKLFADKENVDSQSKSILSNRKLIKLSQHRRTSTPKNYAAKKLIEISSKILRKSPRSFHLPSVQKLALFKAKGLHKQHRIVTTIITKRIVTKETIIGGLVIKREEKQYEDEPIVTEEVINVEKTHFRKSSFYQSHGSSTSLTSSSATKSSSGSCADISSSVSANTPIFTSSSCTTSTSGGSGKQANYFPFLHQWTLKGSADEASDKQLYKDKNYPSRKRHLSKEESNDARRLKKFKASLSPNGSDSQTAGVQKVPLIEASRRDLCSNEDLCKKEREMNRSSSDNVEDSSISKAAQETKLSMEAPILTRSSAVNTSILDEGETNISKLIVAGCKVFAKWVDGYFYSGTALEKERLGRWLISFDDNSVRSVNKDDVYHVKFLPVGSSVYAKLDDDCFDTGIVTDLDIENNEGNYTIELDGGGSRKVPMSSIMMTSDQLACLCGEEKSSSPSSGSISLKNIVEGKRCPKVQQCRSPSTQFRSLSCVKDSPSRSTKKSPSSKRLSVSSPDKTSLGSGDAPSLFADAEASDDDERKKEEDKFAKSPEHKKKSIKKQNLTKSSSKKSRMSCEKDEKLDEVKMETDADSDLGPIPSKGSTLFKGKYFWLIEEPKQIANKKGDDDDTEELLSMDSISLEEVDTHISYSREHLTKQISASGGIVADNIQESRLPHQNCYLISNTHTRTRKYFHCLARGIPCISHFWIIDSCKQNKLLNYKSYLLPTGISIFTKELVEWHNKSCIFEGITVMLTSSQNKNYSSMWSSIFQTAGATVVSRLPTCLNEFPGVIVSDSLCPPSILRRSKKLGIPIVSTEWAVQCLIHGKVLPFNAHADFSNHPVDS